MTAPPLDAVAAATNAAPAELTVPRAAWARAHITRFSQYLLVGASGVVVNLGVFTVAARGLGGSVALTLLASGIAFSVALLWNFGWNFRWTFGGLAHRPLWHHLGLYGGFQLGSLAINLLTLSSILRVAPGAALVGQLVGVALGSAWGYVANRRWNFRGSDLPVGR